MKKANIKDIAKLMKNLDFCMMITRDGNNTLHARPMSNNGQVDYDGDSYFFSYMDTAKVRHIDNSPMVDLIFQTDDFLFIECYGSATITKDKNKMDEMWTDDLNAWFPEGVNTPGICLIKFTAHRIKYWGREGDGEYRAD